MRDFLACVWLGPMHRNDKIILWGCAVAAVFLLLMGVFG